MGVSESLNLSSSDEPNTKIAMKSGVHTRVRRSLGPISMILKLDLDALVSCHAFKQFIDILTQSFICFILIPDFSASTFLTAGDGKRFRLNTFSKIGIKS